MHLSESQLCQLCAEYQSQDIITNVHKETGREKDLNSLLDKYVAPLIGLPKKSTLRVCARCETKLRSWDNFITLCQDAQIKLKGECGKNSPSGSVQQDKTTESSLLPCECSSSNKKRSTNYCIARWCNTGNKRGISLFRIPREKSRAMLWLRAAERTDLSGHASLYSHYLCASHFTPEMFTNQARNYLIKKAIPTLFPRPAYADKTVSKAVLQRFPLHLNGVQLRNILPKTKLPKRNILSQPSREVKFGSQQTNLESIEQKISSTPTNKHVFHHDISKRNTESEKQNSTLVIEVLSADNFALDSNATGCLVQPEKPSPSIFEIPDSQILYLDSESSASLSLPSSEKSYVDDQVTVKSSFGFVECLPPLNSSGLTISEPQSDPRNNASVLEPKASFDASAATKKVLQSFSCNSSEQKQNHQKELIVDLESCFSSETPCPQKSTPVQGQSSQEAQESLTSESEVLKCASFRNVDIRPQMGNENYLSLTGSQDLLLPLLLDKVDQQVIGFSEQSSQVAVAGTDLPEAQHQLTARLSALNGPNLTVNQANELNPPHIGLFDLQSDDISAAENSQYINNLENLEELMDIDHFF